MEEGAKTRKRILTEHAGCGLSLESGLSFEKFKAEYGANLSAPKYHSAPTEGWAFVSEDGEGARWTSETPKRAPRSPRRVNKDGKTSDESART